MINATGVDHTTWGVAPLAAVAVQRMAEVARGYCNLEYDLQKGSRGSRSVHAESLDNHHRRRSGHRRQQVQRQRC